MAAIFYRLLIGRFCRVQRQNGFFFLYLKID